MNSHSGDPSSGTPNHSWFAKAVRLFIAPPLFLFIGFFTADFLLSGIYTWPRTSRTLAITMTALILSYEFVFKEQRILRGSGSHERSVKAVIYSCLLPYTFGFLILLALAGLTS